MNSFGRLSLLTLFLGFSQFSSVAYSDTFYGSPKVVNLSNVIDSTDSPETWIKLSTFEMNSIPGEGMNITHNSDPCGIYFCTGGTIDVGSGGASGYIIYLTRYPVTIRDNSGNSYVFSVAFPNGSPNIYYSEYNLGSGRVIHTPSGMSDNRFIQPSESQEAISGSLHTKLNPCGNLYGCTIRAGAWMQGNVYPSIYIKLPRNLSAQTLTFDEETLLTLSGYISKKDNLGTVTMPRISLKIRGSITIPQRCFLNVDNTSFNFSSLFSNAVNGLQSNKNANVTTTCNYAPEGTKQYMKMTAISGGSLNNTKDYYEVGNESATNKALGIIFKINGANSNCDTNGDIFEHEYLINTFNYGLNVTKSTPINFYLCKFGMPTRTGEQRIILKLTSRWVIE
ncbi:hypothetical protein [Escherichia coli]|uniref:hypothetical protein n=1 Tax=Escherichia coli TaxID=562 RepID=UPI0010CB1782|nr:hypothetical protein [Escherichia coli]GCZ94481.1 hypothetical protein HmCmsJML163_01173 [Escherichia coli]